MARWSDRRLTIALATCLVATTAATAQEVGPGVVVRGAVHENLYLAGGDVDVRAELSGDVIAAGGRVTINGVVTRDALVAGGDVTVDGRVGANVRVAGGMVALGGPIGGELLAAGGRVRLAPETTVAGRAWVAGGAVEVHGRIGKGLQAAGGTIRLDGQVDGDVNLVGREIEIGPAARIGGRLTYRSPRPARIDPGAQIVGGVMQLQPEFPGQAARIARTVSIVLRVLGLLAFMATGVVLLLLFPRFLTSSARVLATDPWKSLGLGLVLFIATPVIVLMLLVSVLGIPLALTVLAVYAIALLVGYLVTALFLGAAGARLLGRGGELSRGAQILALLGALVILALVRWIPVAGLFILFLTLLFGLGALALESYRAYAVRSVAGRPA
jgi:hypothetical protein